MKRGDMVRFRTHDLAHDLVGYARTTQYIVGIILEIKDNYVQNNSISFDPLYNIKILEGDGTCKWCSVWTRDDLEVINETG